MPTSLPYFDFKRLIERAAVRRTFHCLKSHDGSSFIDIFLMDVFTVSCGNTSLIYQKDFDVAYEHNTGAGKAVLTVTGAGAYSGSKSVSFTIKGIPLKELLFLIFFPNVILAFLSSLDLSATSICFLIERESFYNIRIN